MWLIQGCWFQSDEELDICREDLFGEVAVVVKPVLKRALFYGVLHPEPELCGGLFHPASEFLEYPAQGWIGDPSGDSCLFDVSITDKAVSFTKVYNRRTDAIRYTFQRKLGGIWLGEYSGEKVGTGTAWASIVPIEPQFFDPREFARLLGADTLHKWSERIGEP